MAAGSDILELTSHFHGIKSFPDAVCSGINADDY